MRQYRLKIKARKPTTITTTEDHPSERSVRTLLRVIMAQAMHDGMLGLQLGIDREDGTSLLKYYGPVEADDRAWWDMAPPPRVVCYKLVGWILRLAILEDAHPIRGRIPASRTGRHFELALEVPEPHVCQLFWPEEEARLACGSV